MAAFIDPLRAQFEAFKSLGSGPPDRDAEPGEIPRTRRIPGRTRTGRRGPDGRPGLWEIRGRDRADHCALGATILWRGRFETMLIGPGKENWDEMFIARYPTAHHFLEMVTDPAYRLAVIHRQAAVETSRLIRCAPATQGTAFG